MYQAYRSRVGWRSWLLTVALIGTAALQAYILSVFPPLSQPLTPLILGLSILAAILLNVVRFQPRFSTTPLVGPLATAGILVFLIAPTIWTALPLWNGNDTVNPVAGPPQPNALAFLLPQVGRGQPQLTQYLLTNQGQAHYLVGTFNAPTAAPFILDTGKPTLVVGGYDGLEQIMSVQQVVTLIRQKEVRFFILPVFPPSVNSILQKLPSGIRATVQRVFQAYTSSGNPAIMEGTLSHWIVGNCTLVPRAVAEPGNPGPDATVDLDQSHRYQIRLFDCAKVAS